MNGLSLMHAVQEPAGNPREPAPLLLLLHGVGSNEQDLIGLAPMLDRRFFVVSARAPIVLGHSAYGWYHVERTPTGHNIDEEEAERSRQLILQFIDELPGTYNVDPRRVFAMGFSQGCIMSIAAALTDPQRFAGIVGMSGRLLPGIIDRAASEAQLRGLPVLLVHGTEDNVLPIHYGRELREELSKRPVELTYREYAMRHQVSQESLSDISHWLTSRLDTADWRPAPQAE